MSDTAISWTHRPGTRGRTWNPTQGCSLVSPGCKNCYAMRIAARFAEDGWSQGLINLKTRKWNGTVRLAEHKLADPLRWRDPSTVFVNSMSDLFHESLTNEQIAAVFGVMAACPRHTFQCLTKRPARMREWFEWADDGVARSEWMRDERRPNHAPAVLKVMEWLARIGPVGMKFQEHVSPQWPLPNVWLGVSVENQDAADERAEDLFACPAAVYFFSAEPLLGPIDASQSLRRMLRNDHPDASSTGGTWRRHVDWIIAGCESGPGARPCDVAWLRSLRDQCAAADVPFFLKQANERDYLPSASADGWQPTNGPIRFGAGSLRKAGGVIELPYLDGVQHAAFPSAAQ